MIVYGKRSRLERGEVVAASVARMLTDADGLSGGVGRRCALVSAFIRAAELVQGNADAEFADRGFDARSASRDRGSALLLEMAAAIYRLWREPSADGIDLAAFASQVQEMDCGGWIRTRTGEGYAHYALYPESYLDAARRSGLGPHTCVIGIRSIGTGLAALVAAALGAGPAASVRPVGDPFSREIRAAPDMLGSALADPAHSFAVVDEGPGLSGSSFASVAKWLGRHGVEPARIHFFPSYAGSPGNEATATTLDIWRQCPRHSARQEDILSGAGGLRDWLASCIGPIEGPLSEFSGSSSVPRDGRFERRKFLARGKDGLWLVKFAGLGETGLRKLHDAKALARQGFSPEVAGLCHGFLVQKHISAGVLNPDALHASQSMRRQFLATLGAYLAFRADRLGSPQSGATLEELRLMAVQNTARSLGDEAGGAMAHRLRDLAFFEGAICRVRTDNRLHGWEWLVRDGRFMKIDAVDHCESHDLIGCQDIAWDVAGAIAEYALDDEEKDMLCSRIETDGANVSAQLVEAMLPCYLAFQLGLWSTAVERDALFQAKRYRGMLSNWLAEAA